MRRTNTIKVKPRSHHDRLLLLELLDASAACYNDVNYARRQAYFEAQIDEEGECKSIGDLRSAVNVAVSEETYRQRYIQTLSSSTAQQLVRKNGEAWRSFFEILAKYRNPTDTDITEPPSPPGYWKTGDTRQLQTVIRNDQYTIETGHRSRLELPVGMQLKEKYGLGHNDRLRLEVRGRPHWIGKQGRLELVYNRDAESFTAYQAVGTEEYPPRRRDPYPTSLATTSGEDDGVVAAVDIGANNLATVTTSTGDQLLFYGRTLFRRFHRTTEEIGRLQSNLASGEHSSRRIRTLYRVRNAQRDHAIDALVRRLAEWFAERGVDEVVVGELDDVREQHWSTVVNEKVHHFWTHGRFRERLHHVVEDEYGIQVREESEAGTSSRCPACSCEAVHRSGDYLQCYDCGFEGHSDVAASVNFLHDQTDTDIDIEYPSGRSMARPAASRENTTEEGLYQVPCLQWDDHQWQRWDHLFETNEVPANRSTLTGNLASGGVR